MRVAVVLVLFLSACGSSPQSVDAGLPDGEPDAMKPLVLPPPNAQVDYQVGGAYPPPTGVTVVHRDRRAARVEGMYNICYINAFQVQPDEESYWLELHPDLLLRDEDGELVRDTQRDALLLDIRIAEKRQAIASIVRLWTGQCVDSAFDAIELDGIDAYEHSRGLLLEHQAVLQAKLIADAVHAMGRPIAQKNAANLVSRRDELGTDFAVAEECNRYNECDKYTAGYGDHVILVEYREEDFAAGCAAYPNLSIVLRDINLVTPEHDDYVYDGC